MWEDMFPYFKYQLSLYVMKLCFATNNKNKLEEVQEALGDTIALVGLKEIGCEEELPETQDTLEGNSLQKASYVYEHFDIDCFADDTGLEVAALDGAPGVYSARYAGDHRSKADNIQLLLDNLEDQKTPADRAAQFRTVITLMENGVPRQFEGIVKGHITADLEGDGGFGYDPVFVPEGHNRTFAEMSMEEKNKISHRGRAVERLVQYLMDKAKG